MFGFLDVPVSGAYHLVSLLAGATTTVIAIILFTACVRLLVFPLSRAAFRGQQAQAALAPKVQQLREKHKRNPERLNQELSKLYGSAGTSMLSGCLPLLLQAPFFMIMYRLFSSPSVGDTPNELLNHTLLGTQLGQHWLGSYSPVFLILFAALAALAWLSIRIQPQQPTSRLLRLFPYGTILAAAVVPLAAGVYVLTTTAWTIAERAYLRKVMAPATQEVPRISAARRDHR